jgi:outer membrane lipoprotein-sorting protein
MNPDDENRLEQNVDRAVQALKSLPVPDGPPPDLLAAVLAAGEADTEPKTRSLKERITSMNRFLRIAAALSAAAVIIAASLVAFFVWPGGNSGGRAIADMLKSITAKTAKFTITVRMEPQPAAGRPPEQTRQMLVMENLVRQELPGGVHKVMDLKSGRSVTIIPRQKKVLVTKLPGLAQVAKNQVSDDFFGELQRRVEELRASGPKDVEWLGEKDFDGRPARGFHKRVEGIDITVWAAAETCLPVQTEMRYGGGVQQYLVTMSNFEFDVPLDPELFSMAVPDGYTVDERSMNTPPPTPAREETAKPGSE